MKRSSIIQVLALIAMTIDHVGMVFLPEEYWMRFIGRFALPVFCYGIALGYLHTRSIRDYFNRLVILAVVSEVPHIFLFGFNGVNIVFGFVVAVMVMWLLDQRKYISALLVSFVLMFISPEYNFYPLSLILIYRYFEKNVSLSLLLAVLMTFLYCLETGYYIQIFSIFAFLSIAYLPELRERVSIPRNAFYIYYPLHMAVLYLSIVIIRVF